MSSYKAQAFGSREWNPVVVREGRARWRGARAFWLALGYAAFLAGVLCWSYSTSSLLSVAEGATPMEAFGAAARLGREVFSVLCYSQLGAWLLLAPMLTASSLSGERQRGLLEGLLLSRLSASQIVRGKWASALGLIVLLQLAGLPVMAVCFVLGGVSPGEFVGAFAIQLATACCGAACGIAASSYSRNNADAASSAIASVLVWLLLTGLAFPFVSGSGYIPGYEAVLFIAGANPITAMAMLFSPSPSGGNSFSPGLWSVLFTSGCGWMVSVLGMALLSGWHLRRASQVLLRSPEKFDVPPATAPAPASTCPLPASSIAASESWATGPEYAGQVPPQHIRPAGRWQMPLLKRIVFGNAMLRRELSLLWRWPLLSENEKFSLGILTLMIVGLALGALAAIFGSASGARDTWPVILSLYGIAGTLLCAARPASSIAHEREGGLWQGLNLTLLSPLQVCGAKVAAPIIACLGYGIPALIFLLMAAWQGQISLGVTVPGVLLMLLAWTQVASWSVLAGTRARISATALGWSLGGPMLAWIGVPLLLSLLNLHPLAGTGLELLTLLHPVTALDAGSNLSGGTLMLALTLHSALAAMLFAAARRAVQRSHRDRNQKFSRAS